MKDKPSLVVVDSIQTMRTAACANAMGSVTQIRESAARFVQLAKSTGAEFDSGTVASRQFLSRIYGMAPFIQVSVYFYSDT